MTGHELEITVLDSARIFPSRPAEKPVAIPLSIVDASTSNYGPCSAVWYFNRATTDEPENVLPPCSLRFATELRESLSNTLSDFPHFAGRLKYLSHDPAGDHTRRYGRIELTYGTEEDPGVVFTTAHCNIRLDEIVPEAESRRTEEGRIWDLSGMLSHKFIPSSPVLALKTEEINAIAPAVMVQITDFLCGGLCVGVMIAHPLADAHTMGIFMHRWQYEHTQLLAAKGSITVKAEPTAIPPLPLIDPQMVDKAAAGDIEAAEADPAICAKGRSLPTFRHDWYAAPEGKEPELPPGLEKDMIKTPGDTMPWKDWDPTIPPIQCKLFFTGDAVQRMWEAANSPEAPVSKHDAILAHVWQAVSRARGLSEDEGLVYLNIFFGMRKRLGIPDNYVGSPISTTNVGIPGKDVENAPLATIARRIKTQLNLYDREALAARLHDAIFECAPQRLWDAFLGTRHIIITSWARLNLYAVDFGGERGTARFVDPILPVLDGLMQVMEARPETTSGKDSGKKKQWCDDGVDVSLFILKDVKEKLMQDEKLWAYS